MQRESTKHLEQSDIVNKRESHYQHQLSEQIKRIKGLEEQVKQLKSTLKQYQHNGTSMQSLEFDDTQSAVKLQPNNQKQHCEHAAVPRSKSQLSQTMPNKTCQKAGVAVPFLDLTKVIPNFSMKQQEK